MELVAIIRRIDTDGDATVNYSEFAEFVRRGAGGGGGASASMSSPPRVSSANRAGTYSSPLKNTSPARRSSANRTGGGGSFGGGGSPARGGGSPARGSPGPRLRPHDEDELIHTLKDLCTNE